MSEYLSLVLRWVIGIIFIYASATKILYPAEFAKSVEAYRLLPYWSINIVAVFLPWLELICGLFLVIGVTTRAAAAVIGVMLMGFTVGLVVNIVRGSPITCGCFDRVGATIGWWDAIRDLVLVLLSSQIVFFDRILVFRRGGVLGTRKK
jgi:uncharacterized membrane protein YphA (DoxX/SURF4 family)